MAAYGSNRSAGRATTGVESDPFALVADLRAGGDASRSQGGDIPAMSMFRDMVCSRDNREGGMGEVASVCGKGDTDSRRKEDTVDKVVGYEVLDL